ncbi:HalOD1 output domain-containing protein [Halorussus marinus]|uniref:HalOD1 output domain-containing protein n=1 Tax=Halorussus marinus TaxID=2505976 RepID=UPI00106DF620|nr:HalOD1 output domain-containing protein [Halorussus marinus]
MTERDSIIYEIIDHVAKREGKRAENLPALTKTIDPDALKILASDAERIEFTYLGYHVVVAGEDVQVHNTESDDER